MSRQLQIDFFVKKSSGSVPPLPAKEDTPAAASEPSPKRKAVFSPRGRQDALSAKPEEAPLPDTVSISSEPSAKVSDAQDISSDPVSPCTPVACRTIQLDRYTASSPSVRRGSFAQSSPRGEGGCAPDSPSSPAVPLEPSDSYPDEFSPATLNTPFGRQYKKLRDSLEPTTLLFIRKGRFFELYEEDGFFGSQELGLKASRHASSMFLAGVPDTHIETYVRRSLEKGRRVAVADEMETYDKAEKIQVRKIVQVFSVGSVTNPFLLVCEQRTGVLHIRLACADSRSGTGIVSASGPGPGAATMPVAGSFACSALLEFYNPFIRSIGVLKVFAGTDSFNTYVINVISRTSPGEVLISYESSASAQAGTHPSPAPGKEDTGAEAEAEAVFSELKQRALRLEVFLRANYDGVIYAYAHIFEDLCPLSFADRSVQGYFCESSQVVSRQLVSYLSYLRHLDLARKIALLPFDLFAAAHLDFNTTQPIAYITEATASSLNLLPQRRSLDFFDSSEASLFEVLNDCTTQLGSSMLRQWILHPLSHRDTLLLRQDACRRFAHLLGVPAYAKAIGAALKRVTDALKIMSYCQNGFNARRTSAAEVGSKKLCDIGVTDKHFVALVSSLVGAANCRKVVLHILECYDTAPYGDGGGGGDSAGASVSANEMLDDLLLCDAWGDVLAVLDFARGKFDLSELEGLSPPGLQKAGVLRINEGCKEIQDLCVLRAKVEDAYSRFLATFARKNGFERPSPSPDRSPARGAKALDAPLRPFETPAAAKDTSYGFTAFPDRFLVVGHRVLPHADQLAIRFLAGLTQISTTKAATKYMVTDLSSFSVRGLAGDGLDDGPAGPTGGSESGGQDDPDRVAVTGYSLADFLFVLGRLHATRGSSGQRGGEGKRALAASDDEDEDDIGSEQGASPKQQQHEDVSRSIDAMMSELPLDGVIQLEKLLMDRLNSLLDDLKQALLRRASAAKTSIRSCLNAVAQLDVLMALATLPQRYNKRGLSWTYPTFAASAETTALSLSNGYHPYALKLSNERLRSWRPLTFELTNEIAVLTGVNMSGKSTAMRTIGLLVLLAQLGGPVPCDGMAASLFKTILCKVGSDEVVGMSTFQSEVKDVCEIDQQVSNNSTAHNLVIIDEFGRGTDASTGDALAEAVSVRLLPHSVGIVSTHSILVTLHLENHNNMSADRVGEGAFRPGTGRRTFKMCHMGFEQKDGEGRSISFTHRVETGMCTRSFGTFVARLAGLNEDIVARAEDYSHGYIRHKLQQLLADIAGILSPTD